MLVDTHCHLTDERLKNKIKSVLERAELVGIKKIIIPSTSLEDAEQAIEIADKYRGVYCLVGVHPEFISGVYDFKLVRRELRRLAGSSSKVVGVGEIGLDFHYDKEKKTKNKQVELFRAQLELAVELELPVAVHTRDADEETREVLEKYAKLPRGVFHCWGGSKKFLEYVLNKGFYVSFCGNVTYKPSAPSHSGRVHTHTHRRVIPLKDLLRQVPLDKLLLETDSPYLSPELLRGKLNEPKNVKITALFMADILGVGVGSLINQTGKNALCLFSLER